MFLLCFLFGWLSGLNCKLHISLKVWKWKGSMNGCIEKSCGTISIHEDPMILRILIPAAHPRLLWRHHGVVVGGNQWAAFFTHSVIVLAGPRVFPPQTSHRVQFIAWNLQVDETELGSRSHFFEELMGTKVYGESGDYAWPSRKSYKNSSRRKQYKRSIIAGQKLPSWQNCKYDWHQNRDTGLCIVVVNILGLETQPSGMTIVHNWWLSPNFFKDFSQR